MIKTLKPGQEIPRSIASTYQNVIEKYFPTLFELVNRRHPVKKAAAARTPRERNTEGAKPQMEGDRSLGRCDVEQIEKKFKWKNPPSTLEIRWPRKTSGSIRPCWRSSRTPTRATPAITMPP